MDDFVMHIKDLDATTLVAMSMLVGSGAYLVEIFLDSRLLTLMFGFAFMTGALASEYYFSTQGIVVHSDPDANLLLISIGGMIVALLLLLGLRKTLEAMTEKKAIVRE